MLWSPLTFTLGGLMGGLLALGFLVIWVLISAGCGMALGSLFPSRRGAFIAQILAFWVLVSAPFVDVALGTKLYDEFCARTNNIEVFGTILASPSTGFYTDGGEWQLERLKPGDSDDLGKLVKQMDSMVRRDDYRAEKYTRVGGFFPIYERVARIYEASSGRLLVRYSSFHYGAGLFRSTLGSGKQCFPWSTGQDLYRRIFVFKSHEVLQ
jgi:hypothetical protein